MITQPSGTADDRKLRILQTIGSPTFVIPRKAVLWFLAWLLIVLAGVYAWQYIERGQEAAQAKESAMILGAFTTRYGKEAAITQVAVPEKLYLVARKEGGKDMLSIYMAGLWVDIGEMGLPATQGQP